MKTTILVKKGIFLIIAIFAFNFIFADTTSYAKSLSIKNYFQKHLEFPKQMLEKGEEGMVIVDFTITKKGRIKINQINYSNKELKDIVISKLENLSIKKNNKYLGKSYIYKFQFVNELRS